MDTNLLVQYTELLSHTLTETHLKEMRLNRFVRTSANKRYMTMDEFCELNYISKKTELITGKEALQKTPPSLPVMKLCANNILAQYLITDNNKKQRPCNRINCKLLYHMISMANLFVPSNKSVNTGYWKNMMWNFVQKSEIRTATKSIVKQIALY